MAETELPLLPQPLGYPPPQRPNPSHLHSTSRARSRAQRAIFDLLCDHSLPLEYRIVPANTTKDIWATSSGIWRLTIDSNRCWSVDSRAMESLTGVDVSWLHHKGAKGNDPRRPTPATPSATTSASTPTATSTASSNSHSRKTIPPPGTMPPPPPPTHDGDRKSYFPGPVTPPSTVQPFKDTTAAHPSLPLTVALTAGRGQSRRPLLSRASSEKLNTDGKGMPRRPSWISNISSKFSSSPGVPVAAVSTQAPPSGASLPLANGGASHVEAGEEPEPVVPPRPKESGFFSTLTRKLSAGQSGTTPRVQGKGGVCQRRVLNVDPNRERCLVPEVDPSKLRKVSFCVDVEIAGGPKYKDDNESDQGRNQRSKNRRMKERAEGEALKHPELLGEEKDEEGEAKLDGKGIPLPIAQDATKVATSTPFHDGDSSPPGESVDGSEGISRKKEKKKRSEEERKERKKKRRRRAEENGSIPVELSMDAEAVYSSVSEQKAVPIAYGTPTTNTSTDHAKRDRPTTDPVRIYRRCCQLRETPILKRITEQLMSPTCCIALEPGVVHCLDLTGSRLQLADMITLGDWLAVVPVKKLLLEDADLSDEGLRCILAGLLAATKPEPTKRRSLTPRHREIFQCKHYQERSGVVEKLTLKNNPRITRLGWKHVSSFLYMCRSIKAIDLSMIQFPDTMPVAMHSTSVRSPSNAPQSSGQDLDAAELFYKCVSQRLGGDRLEELIMSECGLSAPQIRKVVDAAIRCGINRLGFASNHLDEEGLEHVLQYLRSGVCGGLDLGSNDLRGKLVLIADALNSRSSTSCWALSFADCNLDTESVKPLFPALAKLPNLRFIDLSHNPDLCSQDNGTISLLRRYIGQMKFMKRIHLAGVGMSSKQAIALADVLPEGPQLAHINILENPELSALASAKDEASQEEACALYASYMAAVRVSSTLLCIDIDVPSADNSEVVKALAKQVVAYSLRNMERFAIAEATDNSALDKAEATTLLTQPYGGPRQVKEIAVPDVLLHLVGHIEGSGDNHDDDNPAPDGDYIVGGTGVVKALQYVLGEKADEIRRSNTFQTSGNTTSNRRPGSSAGPDLEQRGKAKAMSKNLLDSARQIRARLQPTLVKEATNVDDTAYRRLIFLDQTLRSMIQRFEEEYPETRITPSFPKTPSTASSNEVPMIPAITTNSGLLDDEDELDEDDAFADSFRPAVSRHNSDVSLASRALAIEEGHLHRLGQRMRSKVIDTPVATSAVAQDDSLLQKDEEAARLQALRVKIEAISGPELKSLVEHDGWDSALMKIGANMNDLRILQEQDPQGWEDFKESQMKARMNLAQDARTE